MLSTLTWDVPFLSQPTHFVTRVNPDILDGITWLHRKQHCFVAYDMLFLENYLWTHFCQFRFLKVRPMVVQLWKKLAWLHIWKAKFSRFYICNDICIGSHRCRGHHSTITLWLCDVVDTDFIRALHPNMRCATPIKVNSFHNTGGPRLLWWNCIISPK
jgi:hypothetical protein